MNNRSLKQENAERAADVIVDCLNHYLGEDASYEAGIRVAVQKVTQLPYQEEEERAVRELHFSGADGFEVKGQLVVANYGGNVYDVGTHLAGHEEWNRDVCIPDLEAPSDSMRPHTREVCQRLLAELERVDGEHSLKEATQRASPGQQAH